MFSRSRLALSSGSSSIKTSSFDWGTLAVESPPRLGLCMVLRFGDRDFGEREVDRAEAKLIALRTVVFTWSARFAFRFPLDASFFCF